MIATVPPKSSWERNPQASGSFRRPLDGLESFLFMLNNSSSVNEHWAISMSLSLGLPVRLSTSDAEACLRRAWLTVCHRHPALTGLIELEPIHKALVLTPLITDSDDSSWLSRTFVTRHDESSSDLPFTALRNTGVPTCHWLPAHQEIHIRCQHWRIYGIGMLMLANSFMLTLASVVSSGARGPSGASSVSKRVVGAELTPSLYNLVNLNLDEATTPLLYKDAADSLVASFIQGVPSIGLPTTPGSGNALPSDTIRETVVLSVAQTEAVVAACKARAVNVASTVHAALVRVTAGYPQHPLAKSYACFLPIDMRRHLPNPPGGDELVVNAFSSGLPIHVSSVLSDDGKAPTKSFDSMVAEIGAIYASDLARPRQLHVEPDVTMLNLTAPYLRRTTKLFATPPPPELPPVQSPDLSTLGKVEEYIKRVYTAGPDRQDTLEVTDFGLGTQMMNRQLQCHVWTFRDRLKIQGCFNISFYERDFIICFLEKVKTELLHGLGAM